MDGNTLAPGSAVPGALPRLYPLRVGRRCKVAAFEHRFCLLTVRLLPETFAPKPRLLSASPLCLLSNELVMSHQDRARSPSEKYYATHLKARLLRSTNSSRDARSRRGGQRNRSRTSQAAILNEKHSPIPLSRVAGLRGAAECYASDTPAPTPLLLSLSRVARIGETRVLA